jgi:hypothetical protein
MQMQQQLVVPQDCVLALGLPTTEEDFLRSMREGNRDYAKHYLGGWVQYQRNFVLPACAFARRCSTLGVKVICGLRSSDFPPLFGRGLVVTLFTHWTATGIEFCDGIVPVAGVVEFVPITFSGVLDLGVCHPDDLVALLLRDRPLCSVRYLSGHLAMPVFWFAFYSAVYQVLALGGRTYSSAVAEVTIELRHQSEGKGKRG